MKFDFILRGHGLATKLRPLVCVPGNWRNRKVARLVIRRSAGPLIRQMCQRCHCPGQAGGLRRGFSLRVRNLSRRQRQSDGEGGAATFAITRGVHSPAMQFGDVADDGQAQPQAAVPGSYWADCQSRYHKPCSDSIAVHASVDATRVANRSIARTPSRSYTSRRLCHTIHFPSSEVLVSA